MRSYYGKSPDGAREARRTDRGRRKSAVKFCIILAITAALVAVAATAIVGNGGTAPKKSFIAFAPEVVASNGDIGQYSSLTLNRIGYPVIFSYNATAQDPYVSAWNGASWSTWGIPTANTYGGECSIATNWTQGAGGGNMYHACFCDIDAGSNILLKYVDNLLMTPVTIDTIGTSYLQTMPSIDVNNDTGSIAISYCDGPNGDLKVAYNKDGISAWTYYTVDSAGIVGEYSNLKFMYGNDSLIVQYYDHTNGNLKQAWAWDQGSSLGPWQNMVIDESSSSVGKWNSQAFSSTGIWYCSFYNETGGSLIFDYWSNDIDCKFNVTVDTIGDVGQYSSIGVNSSCTAFISYYDVSNKNLKLAWNESDVWYNVTLDSTGDVGKYTSLKIDKNDIVYISYYDETNGNLKYIKLLPAEINAMIPEFGEIATPVLCIVAIIAILSARKNRKE